MPDLNQILTLFDKLQGISGEGLIVIACLAIGYGLRYWPWFPNKMIPFAVMTFATFAYPVLADPKVATQPFRVWLVRNICIGFIIGAGSWLLHFLVIRRIEKLVITKFGGNGDTGNTQQFSKDETVPTNTQQNKP